MQRNRIESQRNINPITLIASCHKAESNTAVHQVNKAWQ